MTSISAQLLPTHLLLLAFSLALLGRGKWKAVESGRSNDTVHMVKFANLFQSAVEAGL
jgi:hypothetical protein